MHAFATSVPVFSLVSNNIIINIISSSRNMLISFIAISHESSRHLTIFSPMSHTDLIIVSQAGASEIVSALIRSGAKCGVRCHARTAEMSISLLVS
eukprot:6207468-Pleurochrysis_carterae.AAC.1